MRRRTSHDCLSDAVLTNEGGRRSCSVSAGEMYDLGTEVRGESYAAFEYALSLVIVLHVIAYMQDIEFRAEGFRQSCPARDQVPGLRASADADGYLFGDSPLWPQPLAFDVLIQSAIHRAGYALERHLAKCDEIASPEEVCEGPLNAIKWIDVSASHASDERFGRDVADDNLVGLIQDPVRHLLPNRDAGERLHAGSEALHMLNVNRAENIDLVLQQQEDVFVALCKAATLDVGVSQFINKRNLRSTGENCVYVHFGKKSSFVLQFATGNVFQFVRQFCGSAAAMRFYDAHHHIFAAPMPPYSLAQHAEGLSDTRGVAQKYFEAATLLLGLAGL